MAWSLSTWRRGRVLLAALVIAVGLMAVWSAQPVEAAPVSPPFLCVSHWTGQISYLPAGCPTGFQALDLSAGPVTVCANSYTRQLSRSSANGSCPPGTMTVQIGATATTLACANRTTGKVALRTSAAAPCTGWELQWTSSTSTVQCVDCPLAVPPTGTGPGTTISTLNVSGLTGTIADVNVNLDIAHTFIQDLDVTLTSPGGTVVALFTDLCGDYDDMLVTLDDETPLTIGATCPPNGTFRPESDLLSDFDGAFPNGVWTLTILDDLSRDAGTLHSWSLAIITGLPPSPPPAVPPNVFCDDCPLPVPPVGEGPGTTISLATASGLVGTITDVNVNLDIPHTYVSDLEVTLTSPGGTAVTLFAEICLSTDDLLVMLDHGAAVQIGDDCPPNGTFRPQVGLSTLLDFNGENPNGVWTLTVHDGDDGDAGMLLDWSLAIATD